MSTISEHPTSTSPLLYRSVVLVTGASSGMIGATGRLGQAVVRQAVNRTYTVTAMAREPHDVPELDCPRVVRGDVLVPSTLDAALPGQDAVVCALGTPSPRRPLLPRCVSPVAHR